MMQIDAKRTPSRMQLLNAAAAGATTTSSSPDYVLQAFTTVAEVTVPHGLETEYVTVTVYTTNGFIFPQTKIRAIQCSTGSVRVAFHAAESGVVKVSL